jgi:HEAT repeat protein
MFNFLKTWQLARQAKDPNSLVRERAIVTLAEIDPVGSAAIIIAALEDPHRDVQVAAAEALQKSLNPAAIEPMLNALAHRKVDARAKQVLLRTLEKYGLAAHDALLKKLADDKYEARAEVAQLLGLIKDAGAVDALAAALKIDDVRTRKEASHALGFIGGPAAVAALLPLLDDSRWLVRAETAESLGRLGDKRAVDALIKRLGDEKWLVQRSAAKALASLGDPRAIEPLVVLLKNPKEDVRDAAAENLGALGDPRVLAPLLGLLADQESAEAAVAGLRALLTRAADRLGAADLQKLSSLADPSQAVYDSDEPTGRGAAVVRATGTRKVDCTALRKLASDALARKK